MEKPKHIQLLELLQKEGIGVAFDLSPFLSINFKQPQVSGNDNVSKDKYAQEIRHISLFISDLEGRGFISPDENLMMTGWINWSIHMDKPVWFDTVTTFYHINSKGLDYLEKYESTQIQTDLNKSYINVNSASILNYKIQIGGMIITIIIAGLAALYSVKTYFKPEPKMAELNKNIKSLSTSLDSIKAQIYHLQSQKTSPAERYHRH